MTVKEAVKQSGTGNVLFAPFISSTQKLINENEEVLTAITANVVFLNNNEALKIDAFKIKNKLNGLVVITSERIMFCNRAFGIGEEKSILLNNIQSIDDKTNLISAKLRIKGITETFVIDISSKTLKEFKNTLNSAMIKSKENKNTVNIQNSTTPADEILKLKNLLDMGAITQEEFDIKKKELLDL